MTTTNLDQIGTRQVASQTTAIESSRAVAQVYAAMLKAERDPRSVAAAVARMRESCQQMRLAERAFFQYPRGRDDNGKPVTVAGPSIHLARELARCWRHVDYSVVELDRDDVGERSEMLAFAWDMVDNVRSSAGFIVPHARDTKKGRKPLLDLRDIYENNANVGARRLRECIFGVLPDWYVEEAKALCAQTVEKGDGKPLARRIADAIELFDHRGIVLDQLEQKIGAPARDWTAWDVAQLVVSYQSLQQGTVQAEEEFPPRRVTNSEIQAVGAAQSPATPPAAPGKQQPGNGSEANTQPPTDGEYDDTEGDLEHKMSGRRATPPGAAHSVTRTSRGGDPGRAGSAVSGDDAEPATPAAGGATPPAPPASADPPVTPGQLATLRTLARALHRDVRQAADIIGRPLHAQTELRLDEAELVIGEWQAELDRAREKPARPLVDEDGAIADPEDDQ